MSRIAACMRVLRDAQRSALVPYVMAGDPGAEETVALMHAMVEAGANMIELGVPFSDPMADGPVIQKAAERALKGGMSLRGVIDIVHRFRRDDASTPVVLMGYLNPVERMGYDTFVTEAASAGVDGVLTVDLPPEEAESFTRLLREADIDPIFLLSPTTTSARMRAVCEAASGFVYYVSLKGVTGAASLDMDEVGERVRSIREITDLPVGVGFGISDAETASRMAMVADAVVVGSALVKRMQAHADNPARMRHEVSELLSQMRQAMDSHGGRYSSDAAPVGAPGG